MEPREIGERILREAGIHPEALAAKRHIDARLAGLGLPPSIGAPRKLEPGQSLTDRVTTARSEAATAGAVGAAGGVLLDPAGRPLPYRVVPGAEVSEELSEAMFEPSDLIAAQAVTGLATTVSGGTEVRFNLKGLVHVGSGAIGVYWNRALGAAQNFRWAPLAPGLILSYDPRQGLFVGTNGVGGITIGGVLTLSFYRLPPKKRREENVHGRPDAQGRTAPGAEPGSPWAGAPGGGSVGGSDSGGLMRAGDFRLLLSQHVAASGSDMTAGVANGPENGTDVTLGTFSDAGAGTQIYKVGTNFPIAGAGAIGKVILNALPSNTDTVWIGETAALAIASNGALGASGQDSWNRPLNGTLFMLALTGTQVIGARYRS